MFEHIKAAEEKLAANLDPRPHIVAALHAVAVRLDDIGKTADGAVAEQVKALDERLTSLTSAVTGVGNQYTELTGLMREAMVRMDDIEAKLRAPNAPAVPAAQTPPPQQ
jgi:hypothetical protein